MWPSGRPWESKKDPDAYDVVERDGRVVPDAGERDRYDCSVRGYKKWLKEDPEAARAAARRVILHTYRTLMSRGMRGCWVWSVDEGTNEYLRACASRKIGG